MKPLLLFICLFLLISSNPAPKEDAPAYKWPVKISKEHYPGTYLHSPGSALDKENIDWNLEKMKEAGIRTAHIVPIYGAKGYEERYITFLSPKWIEMLDYMVRKAKSLGMNFDMTTGTGWCFGGPGLNKNMSDSVSQYKKKKNKSPKGMQVKRAAPGGEGPMIDPYSPKAMKFYLERFSKAFDEGKPAMPRAQYHDSFEYKGNWSTDILKQFKIKRGYDLEEHFDAFFSKKSSKKEKEKRARIKCDYRLTLSEMHFETMKVWTDWAKKRKMITRNEAHGAPANLLDVYALSDIPETEMFGSPDYPIPGFRRNPLWSRKGDSNPLVCAMASSAAHIAHKPGNQLVASETCTWLREHWHTSLAHIKLELDDFFLSGVNHIFYHGTCYSPKDAPWPGWFFYAGTQFNWRNSIWRDFSFLNEYAARCQSILQAGRPSNDLLVYWPICDYWTDPKGMTLPLKVHDPKWMYKQRFGILAKELIERGYALDFISDRLLKDINFNNGHFQAKGGTYRIIIIPACKYMPNATLQKLAKLAEKGAPIIFEKEIPNDVPGFFQIEERRKELEISRKKLAKSTAVVSQDIFTSLKEANIPRETFSDVGIKFIKRKTDKGYYYFLVNQTAKPFEGWTKLSVPFASSVLYDPLQGETGKMAIQKKNNKSRVFLQIQPGESRILFASMAPASAPEIVYLKPEEKRIQVKGEWQIEFIKGGPNLPAPYKLKKLASWTEAPDEKAKSFAGTARYSISFTLPEKKKAVDWVLDLGDVRESARVKVNKKNAGTLFCLPFKISIGKYLKTGKNLLEIEITNLTANRIRDLDLNNTNWKIMKNINIVSILYKEFNPAKWDLLDSGLLGPVTLIPMKTINP